MLKDGWQIIKSLIVCLFTLILFYNITIAGEGIKAGDIIGQDNWEKAKGYVPEVVLKEIRDGYTFKVTAEPIITGTPAFIKASRESRTKLGPDGGLEGYNGGIPFYNNFNPDGKDAALKAGWNLYRTYFGDDSIYALVPGSQFMTKKTTDPDIRYFPYSRRHCIDKYGNERISDIISYEMQVANSRVDEKLEPSLEKKLSAINFYNSNTVLSPRDLAGTVTLQVRHWDAKKDDDFFIYIPSLRRIRRLPTSQRSATRTPADYTWDDVRGFSGKVPFFNWKIVGEGTCLVGRTKTVPTLHRKGSFLHVYKEWSLHDYYAVQNSPKDTAYKIPKRILWVSKDAFDPLYWFLYDKKGELWRSLATAYAAFYDTAGKVAFHLGYGLWVYDEQTLTSTNAECNSSLNTGLEVGFFSLSNLITSSRGQMLR
ncbi:MAG: DUF1329 domain-containing protein [Thermodesulfobacteriota bacterium]|nr:DUF1329 domain-containing protein [Thermodesulfobacteriota bacterium]